MTKFEDVPEEVLTDPTMRTALGMDPIPGMNTPVDEPTIFTNSSTATPEVKVFKNLVHPEFGELRVLEIDDELWFIGKEVANALGYKDLKNAVKAHVNAEDRKLLLRGQNTPLEIPNRGLTIINESGLYSLILSSKLPSAKEFKHWVTSEVLPSIRKNGAYIRNQENMTPAEIVARGLIAAQKIIEERDKEIALLNGRCGLLTQTVDEKQETIENSSESTKSRRVFLSILALYNTIYYSA